MRHRAGSGSVLRMQTVRFEVLKAAFRMKILSTDYYDGSTPPYRGARNIEATLESAKRIAARQTIVGPVGVSK